MKMAKSFCRVKNRVRDSRYARIDPSRQVIMTEAIFVLHKILKKSKTRGNLENPRKSGEIGFYQASGPIFLKGWPYFSTGMALFSCLGCPAGVISEWASPSLPQSQNPQHCFQ